MDWSDVACFVSLMGATLLAGCGPLFFWEPPAFEPPPCAQDERVEVRAKGDGEVYGCVPCAPGSTNAPGDARLDGTSQCDATLCGPNERVNDHVCEPCARGQMNEAGDDASGEDTLCEPIRCAFGERVAGNVCVECPVGTFNKAGDDATGEDTQCDDDAMCGEDQRVQSQECVACAPGTTRPAGDPQLGEDTQCEVIRCGSDEFVSGNECTPCARGSLNAPGDDASGVDTACDAVLCGVDEYVLGNACEVCPEGTTNEAGDDASGGDTRCEDACETAFGVTCERFEDAYVKASNVDPDDRFGFSIAIDGDTMVVGATREDSASGRIDMDQSSNGSSNSGAAYVFERDAQGRWIQLAYLKAPNSGESHSFGAAVDISGDLLVVGAPGETGAATGVDGNYDTNAPGSGAVYVFGRLGGGQWSFYSYLKASNTDAGDLFGFSVAIDGETIVVGSFFEDSASITLDEGQDDNSAPSSGAAYVFESPSLAVWEQVAYLKASNTGADDQFGISVDVHGDVIVVGAAQEGSSTRGVDGDASLDDAPESGAAYVFERSSGSWQQTAYLKASNAEAGDRFGLSVAVHGERIAVGAPFESSSARGVGGDPDNEDAPLSGAVYVFERSSGSWQQTAYIKASNADSGSGFGTSLDLGSSVLVVGAPNEASSATGVGGAQDDETGPLSGAVYVFTKHTGHTWAQNGYIKSSNTQSGDKFGNALSFSEGRLALSAPEEDSGVSGVDGANAQADESAPDSGAVYVRIIGQ